MSRPEPLSTDGPLTIEQTDPQGRVALSLLREAAIEARALYPEAHPPGGAWPGNPPTPARGVYLVGFVGGMAVACGALQSIDGDAAEVRRMFVQAARRRHGFARAILTALEDHARAFGYLKLRLETGNRQGPAIALYAACGFRRIAPFGEHADDPTSVCFEKDLAREPLVRR